MSVDVRYRTKATATGGRDGAARSEDGVLAVTLSTPKELGGAGGSGTNPEQLFAAGYSACFIGALKVAGSQLKIAVPDDTSVTATVGIGPRSEGGFGITADLAVSLPGLDRDQARKLVDAAHQICPYSNATRDNVDVGLTAGAHEKTPGAEGNGAGGWSPEGGDVGVRSGWYRPDRRGA